MGSKFILTPLDISHLNINQTNKYISRSHFIREPSCSFEGDVTTGQNWKLCILISFMVDRFQVQSLSVEGNIITSISSVRHIGMQVRIS